MPYATVRLCDAEIGKPGADCAAASARRAPMLRAVFPDMLAHLYADVVDCRAT